MTGDCEDCGDPVERKNAAGHYRDKCWSCIEAASQLGDDRNPFRWLADQEREQGTLSTRRE